MQKEIVIRDTEFPVKVKQTGKDNVTVTYGQQTKKGLSYEAAAKETGLCLFHLLACEGEIEPTQ